MPEMRGHNGKDGYRFDGGLNALSSPSNHAVDYSRELSQNATLGGD